MSFLAHVAASAVGFVLAAVVLYALHAVGDAWARWKARRAVAAAERGYWAADWTGPQSTRESIRRDRDTANDMLIVPNPTDGIPGEQ